MGSEERWLAVPGWEGLYEVSDRGGVRGLDRVDSRGRHCPGVLLAPFVDGVGRHQVTLTREGRRSLYRVHRLVLEAFVGPAPAGTEACHGNGQPGDNRLGNLRWDTSSENEFDKVRHGTHQHARKTQCPHGHEYSPPNTRIRRSGARECRACTRARKVTARGSRG